LIISFDIFNQFPEITQFCTTRQGGVSEGNFASLNINPFVGDNNEHQRKNIEILKDHINSTELVFPYQSHGAEIYIIDDEYWRQNVSERNKTLHGIDALITNRKDICIGVTTADCVPITFYDPHKQVIAVAHAGWRGTCSRIVEKTIEAMHEKFDCQPSELFALIGPSISVDVYTVGNEVYESFNSAKFPVELIFKNTNNLLHLDLWIANCWLLEQSGIPSSNIHVAEMCTYIQNDIFFSARKQGIKSGRMLNGIMMRSK